MLISQSDCATCTKLSAIFTRPPFPVWRRLRLTCDEITFHTMYCERPGNMCVWNNLRCITKHYTCSVIASFPRPIRKFEWTWGYIHASSRKALAPRPLLSLVFVRETEDMRVLHKSLEPRANRRVKQSPASHPPSERCIASFCLRRNSYCSYSYSFVYTS